MFLFSMFADNPFLIIPWIAALIIAITIHEFAHGFAAYKLGDDTAERTGRLTLNPLAHIDPMGALMLLLVGFGWAKPVPINPNAINKGRLGHFIVSVAGIGTNMVFAILCVLGLKLLLLSGFNEFNFLVKFFAFLIYIDLALFVFNLIPVAPLDGYQMFKSYAPGMFYKIAPFIERWGFYILIGLIFLTNIIGVIIFSFINIISAISGINILGIAFGGF